MNVKATLTSLVLASSLYAGCSSSEHGQDPAPFNYEPVYSSPQVAFAEWMVANDVKYFGSPAWCPPCQLFEYNLTPDGFAVLKRDGKFVECSTSFGESLSQGCADAGVKVVPSFSAPWLNGLMEGYLDLETLARDLGYPGNPLSDHPNNYNGDL